jgi:hypothetical protein
MSQAIGVLYENPLDKECERLINTLQGIVFLGCPHVTFENRLLWDKLGPLLRAVSKQSKSIIANSRQSEQIVASISHLFTKSNLAVEISDGVRDNTAETSDPIAAQQDDECMIEFSHQKLRKHIKF